MDEYVHVQYVKEEEFLEEHYETADVLRELLGQDWKPNYQCNDAVRERRRLLLANGQLHELAFDTGVIFHRDRIMSSIGIYLRSSTSFWSRVCIGRERMRRLRFCVTGYGRRSDDGLARDASRSRTIRTRSSISCAAAYGRAIVRRSS
jgi:hypothetical protein